MRAPSTGREPGGSGQDWERSTLSTPRQFSPLCTPVHCESGFDQVKRDLYHKGRVKKPDPTATDQILKEWTMQDPTLKDQRTLLDLTMTDLLHGRVLTTENTKTDK